MAEIQEVDIWPVSRARKPDICRDYGAVCPDECRKLNDLLVTLDVAIGNAVKTISILEDGKRREYYDGTTDEGRLASALAELEKFANDICTPSKQEVGVGQPSLLNLL